ncbi:uncharacterized protein LOC111798043 isoform X1 [Cucurbita pepo subsp. pepo]|uniref:uncharacterized protein LOC111798043 isoform X1 n=1 Tax=Cucurbita pepo subsp. pepo TaxID=3664 RepID=UPI000C9D5BA9|nr:uncharacterized protein LOC111798043 isoform X1 [Cucurbita pepo subsp. pepo]
MLGDGGLTPCRVIVQVLTETDDCYCVLLNAHDGIAFPGKDYEENCNSSNVMALGMDSDSLSTKNSQITTLYSGFVSYQMVCDAYDGIFFLEYLFSSMRYKFITLSFPFWFLWGRTFFCSNFSSTFVDMGCCINSLFLGMI